MKRQMRALLKVTPPPPQPRIERVSSLRVPGVTVNDKFLAAEHVAVQLSSASSMLYAMRVMRSHGAPTTSLHDIFRSIVISRIQYAAPAWSGMCLAAHRAQLDSLLRCSKRLGYCSDDIPAVIALFNSADDDFFFRVKTNPNHVLQPYLPDQRDIPYKPRAHSHNMT